MKTHQKDAKDAREEGMKRARKLNEIKTKQTRENTTIKK